MNKKLNILVLIIFLSVFGLMAQTVKWQPKKQTTPKIELFHSTQSIHFATSTFLRKGEFEYEISHRFLPPVTTEKAFLGIDGPARIRMGLAYGLTGKTMLMLARSNNQDNIDFYIKQQVFALPNSLFPTVLAVRAGLGWNTEVINRKPMNSKNLQPYLQLIFNTMYKKKLALGLVPSYLYNSHIYCSNTRYSFTIGSYVQYYLGSMWSLFMESNTTVTGYRGKFNSLLFGFELETGGHFFKIFIGNNASPNPSQYLSGADLKFAKNNLRLGFNITRILKF